MFFERSSFKFDKEYQIFELNPCKQKYQSIDFILFYDDVELNEIDHNKEKITYKKGFFLKK